MQDDRHISEADSSCYCAGNKKSTWTAASSAASPIAMDIYIFGQGSHKLFATLVLVLCSCYEPQAWSCVASLTSLTCLL